MQSFLFFFKVNEETSRWVPWPTSWIKMQTSQARGYPLIYILGKNDNIDILLLILLNTDILEIRYDFNCLLLFSVATLPEKYQGPKQRFLCPLNLCFTYDVDLRRSWLKWIIIGKGVILY